MYARRRSAARGGQGLFVLETMRAEAQGSAVFIECAPHVGGDAFGDVRLDCYRHLDPTAGEGRQVSQNLLCQLRYVAAGLVGVDLYVAVEAAKRRERG